MSASIRSCRLCACLVVLIAGATATRVSAQSIHNVLLVVNDASDASRQIGEHYARARGVPESQVVRLRVDAGDEIERAEFERLIERPLGEWLSRHRAYDRILYIVLTKGIPLRIRGTPARQGTESSVDSELTLLYRKLVGLSTKTEGPIANPYFLKDVPPRDGLPFTHEQYDFYLVTRLDGFTVAEVQALVDRSGRPVSGGTVMLDQRGAPTALGNRWLEEAALRVARSFAARVRVQRGVDRAAEVSDVIGYYAWEPNDPTGRTRWPNVSFAAGAVGGLFASADARTFTEPATHGTQSGQEGGQLARPRAPLTGDLIRLGITGVAGHVADPYLEGAIRPHILFPAYLGGRNLAESFYLAMPYLSWHTIVVGDPLATVSNGDRLPRAEADPAPDPATELPAYFSARRARVLARTGAAAKTIELYLRGETRARAGDRDGARRLLEEATSIDGQFVLGHLFLASVYEEAHEYDLAVERYRRILTQMPDNVIALNNLAYALAVHLTDPRTAFPFAERAHALASGNSSIADTLGWIHHLLGDEDAAAALLRRAVDGDPGNAEAQFHLAIVLAARGALEAASSALTKAITLKESIATRDEVRQLRSTLDASVR